VILIKFKKEIKGSSLVDGHSNWINVDTMQLGVGRSVSMSSGGSGKREVSSPNVSEVVFTRNSDMASPELFFQACGGVSLEECEIHLIQIVENAPKVYGTILLTDPLVTSYSMSSGGDNPTESFALNFTKISYQYDTFDGKKVTTGTPKKWDLSVNKTF
jgi:type VI secretion system secreted protein Hcp